MPARLFLPDGSATSPGLTFRTERGSSGFYRNAVGSIGVAIRGALAFAIRATSISVAAGASATAGGAEAIRIGTGALGVLGIYWGSGAPTFAAPKGSLYLRTDGSSTSTRSYIASDAVGGWTNHTTAA